MRFAAFGGLKSLRLLDLPRPEAKPGEIVVEVAATSVNPIDWKLRSGVFRWVSPLRFSSVPCFDFAGKVAEVGAGIDRLQPGMRVFGLRPLDRLGAACEAIVAAPSELVEIPSNVSMEQAAGVPLAGMTALQALRTPKPSQPSEKVLIVGASGGVGHYAVQIGKALAADITAVCSTPNLGWVRDLGADAVLDYARGETDSPRPVFDRVFDAVSLGTFAHWRRWLKPDGVYVTLLPRGELLLHRVTSHFQSSRQGARAIFLRPNQDDLSTLAKWMEEGKLQTVIDSVYALEELGAAFDKSRAGHARGKIIVRLFG